MTYIKKE